MVFLGILAGGVLGAEPQGKDLTMPSLEGVKPLEEGQIPKEKLYSLSVRDADLKEVLFAFSKDNEVNIIVDPDVFGKVTVDLKKVTMAAALEALLKPLDLDYQQEGNLIRVTRPKMETRTFILNYLTTIRKGSGSVSGIGGSSAASRLQDRRRIGIKSGDHRRSRRSLGGNQRRHKKYYHQKNAEKGSLKRRR